MAQDPDELLAAVGAVAELVVRTKVIHTTAQRQLEQLASVETSIESVSGGAENIAASSRRMSQLAVDARRPAWRRHRAPGRRPSRCVSSSPSCVRCSTCRGRTPARSSHLPPTVWLAGRRCDRTTSPRSIRCSRALSRLATLDWALLALYPAAGGEQGLARSGDAGSAGVLLGVD